MSSTISGPNGVFKVTSLVDKVAMTTDQLLDNNGITAKDLLYKLDKITTDTNPTGLVITWGQMKPQYIAQMKFFDSLTPAQLNEKTLTGMGGGTNVATFGDLKTYTDLLYRLNDLSDKTDQGSTNNGDISGGNGTVADVQHAYVSALIQGVYQNIPGAVDNASKYLSSTQNNDQVTFSRDAVQHIIKSQVTYQAANPDGNWNNSSSKNGANAALATLTDAANALVKEKNRSSAIDKNA